MFLSSHLCLADIINVDTDISANNICRRYIGRAVAEFGKVCSHAVLHSLCKLRGTRVKQLDLFFSKTLSKTELKKSSNCSHNLEY